MEAPQTRARAREGGGRGRGGCGGGDAGGRRGRGGCGGGDARENRGRDGGGGGDRRRIPVTEEDQGWFDASRAAAVPVSGRDALALFRRAFTHRSAAHAPPTSPGAQRNPPRADQRPLACNERLEFLGDAVISAAVARYLFDRFPEENEGFLTDMRSKLVRGSALADLAVRTGLARGLVRGPGGPSGEQPRDFDPAHEDLFEAVAGAISIDSGFDSAAEWVTAAIERHVDVSDLVRKVVSSRDALQREARALGISDFDVEVTGQPGGAFKAVARCDSAVAGVGEGPTAKKAAELACAAARTYLGLAA